MALTTLSSIARRLSLSPANGELNRQVPSPHTIRRKAVSAECTDFEELQGFKPQVIEKSEESRRTLSAALRRNYLFSSLDEEQITTIVDAVKEVKFDANQEIIMQGDKGDHFYLLQEGECEVSIKTEEEEGCRTLKNYFPGDSFGELALLYNTPRAATVKAVTDCVVGAVDRQTFRAIVLTSNRNKKELYENFLEDVPILKVLDKNERSAIADVLIEEKYSAGDKIVIEGEPGEKMFFLENGEAEAITKGNVVMKYRRGDYFGELTLLHNTPRATTVRAVTTCKCASIDRDSFKRIFGKLEDTLNSRTCAYAEKNLDIERLKV